MKRLLTIILLSAVFSGCATVTTCPCGGRVTIDIENASWLLLNTVPIASGEPDTPNFADCRWFENTATLGNNMLMLEREMRRIGAYRADNIVSHTSDETFLFILLKHKTYHTSAEPVFDFNQARK